MHDYYETLQVHPKADADAIRAAYERLRQRYDTAVLASAPDEQVASARHRRDELERAYAVLGDPARRTAFDQEIIARNARRPPVQPAKSAEVDPHDDSMIDYRPLPPAQRQERAKDFNPQPYLPTSQAPRQVGRRIEGRSRLPSWLPAVLIVAVATFAIVLITLLTTVSGSSRQAADGQSAATTGPVAGTTPTVSTDEVVNQFESQLAAARQVANQVPTNANAWIELGNALYDSVVVVRELIDSGHGNLDTLYVERLPRWLEARDAYVKALAITPGNPTVQADMASALCYYGAGVNDQSYVAQGLTAAEQAVSAAPEHGRALLSKGLCLAVSDPPQTAAALEQWQKAIVMPNVEPGVVQQARQLIAAYSR
ncbi:MAG: DnaJ domain-containing protein [Oscillochloris sp.]|nr:DnaJ domain-containing protein [Oscillochloris sp.]